MLFIFMFEYVLYLWRNFIHVPFDYTFWTIIVYRTFIFQLCTANIHMNKDAQPHKSLQKSSFAVYKLSIKLFAYFHFVSILATRRKFDFLRRGMKMHVYTTW